MYDMTHDYYDKMLFQSEIQTNVFKNYIFKSIKFTFRFFFFFKISNKCNAGFQKNANI